MRFKWTDLPEGTASDVSQAPDAMPAWPSSRNATCSVMPEVCPLARSSSESSRGSRRQITRQPSRQRFSPYGASPPGSNLLTSAAIDEFPDCTLDVTGGSPPVAPPGGRAPTRKGSLKRSRPLTDISIPDSVKGVEAVLSRCATFSIPAGNPCNPPGVPASEVGVAVSTVETADVMVTDTEAVSPLRRLETAEMFLPPPVQRISTSDLFPASPHNLLMMLLQSPRYAESPLGRQLQQSLSGELAHWETGQVVTGQELAGQVATGQVADGERELPAGWVTARQLTIEQAPAGKVAEAPAGQIGPEEVPVCHVAARPSLVNRLEAALRDAQQKTGPPKAPQVSAGGKVEDPMLEEGQAESPSSEDSPPRFTPPGSPSCAITQQLTADVISLASGRGVHLSEADITSFQRLFADAKVSVSKAQKAFPRGKGKAPPKKRRGGANKAKGATPLAPAFHEDDPDTEDWETGVVRTEFTKINLPDSSSAVFEGLQLGGWQASQGVQAPPGGQTTVGAQEPFPGGQTPGGAKPSRASWGGQASRGVQTQGEANMRPGALERVTTAELLPELFNGVDMLFDEEGNPL